MYSEADFIPLSALQHYLYCPRQCALIHLEDIWTENAYTAEGQLLHERADSGMAETRGNVKTVTGLLLRSAHLGLSGKADMVEFYRHEGAWSPYPVEYKRGRPKKHNADRVQLCAQGMCLEEMLRVTIPEGALFYGKTRRRQTVLFSEELRDEVCKAALAVHELLRLRATPPPVDDDRCAACSLFAECLPKSTGERKFALRYVESLRESA